MFGPQDGWDAKHNKGHHRKEVKAPSKNTQQNASTLIQQTIIRKTENSMIEQFLSRAGHDFCTNQTTSSKKNPIGGSKYIIYYNSHSKKPTMQWNRKRNFSKPHLPQDVIKFCSETFLSPNTDGDVIHCFTEYNCPSDDPNNPYKF